MPNGFFDTIDYTKMKPGTSWGITIQKCKRCKRLGKVTENGMIHKLKLAVQHRKFDQVVRCKN